ncbi:NAD(P)H-binding protein [Streptomyces bauhiniae]|uniref:NAD(P)H-binding protein n=1 Tax=Streptomyces bauhiniae TaxID=2340725 RepID=UPI00364E228C
MTQILVLGGNGKVGRRLIGALRGRGHQGVAASRSSALRFDWHDPSTWPRALQGADAVFVVGPGSAHDWSGPLSGFLDLAAKIRVRHAVLLSARAVQFLPGGAVDLAEQALAAGPVPWTVLRPTHFAQNFTEAMFTPNDGVITAPSGCGAEPFVDVQDVAEAAAQILARRSHISQNIALSGPAALTFSQAAAALAAASGTAVRFVDQEPAEHAARLAGAGTAAGYVRWRTAMLDAIRTGADAYLSHGVQDVLGRPATDFVTWAAREVPGAAFATGRGPAR